MKRVFFTLVLFSFLSFKETTTVLICLSPTSYAYHNGSCKGLDKCTHEIIKVSKDEALNKYGKTKACGYCF